MKDTMEFPIRQPLFYAIIKIMGGIRRNTYWDEDTAFVKSYLRIHSEKKEKTKEQIIRSYWNGMRNRVKTKSYSAKGILVNWSFEEFSSWFERRWGLFNEIESAGEVPSIDRIDSSGNYEESNCRMIPNCLNSALGEVNYLIQRMKTLQNTLSKNSTWLTEQLDEVHAPRPFHRDMDCGADKR